MTLDKPYLGRCKDCDYALFASPDQIKNANDASDVKAGAGPFRLSPYGVMAKCPSRHKFFTLRQIKGTYSKDHKCDSRCLNAKGHNCTCSCGGLNHGRGYAVEHVHDASAALQVPLATENQRNFMGILLNERKIPDSVGKSGEDRRNTALEMLKSSDPLRSFTKIQASNVIKWLLELPKLQSE